MSLALQDVRIYIFAKIKDTEDKSMKKRQVLITGIILLAGVSLSGCSQKAEKKTEKENITVTVAPTINVVSLPEDSYGTIKGGVYTSTGGAIQINVPDSWNVSKENATVLVAGKEEETKDCVSIQFSEKDEKFKDYKKEDFATYYDQHLDNFNLVKFEYTTVAGLDALYLEYTFSQDDSDITGYQYIIDGNYSYTIVFTDVSGELKDDMQGILDSMVICK